MMVWKKLRVKESQLDENRGLVLDIEHEEDEDAVW